MNLLTLALPLLLTGCVTTASLSNGKVSVIGADDPLETSIWINTSTYKVEARDDHFWRKFIDKKSGASFIQLYVAITDSEWMYWDKARSMIDGELVEFEVNSINRDVTCGQYGCLHTESVGVVFKESQVVAMSRSGGTVRFTGNVAGMNQDIVVDTAEIKAFLAAIDSHAAKQKL